MNSSLETAVERRVLESRFMAAIAVAVAMATMGACTQVQGGAVEFSWSLRTFGGEFIPDSCQVAHLNTITLSWAPANAPSATPGSRDFDCISARGVTEFEIAEGRQLLWLTPVCDDGEPADPGTYEVPPAIVRQVREGEVVTLNSLLIVFQGDADPDDNDDVCKNNACTCER